MDSDTESVVFLTNESDQPARIGCSVTANEVTYYLTMLVLAPHETRAINIRALRDAQIADFKRNKIPAAATDGSVTWIRLDNVPVMGRLCVIQRHNGMTATYDCCYCPCPDYFQAIVGIFDSNYNMVGLTYTQPQVIAVQQGGSLQLTAYGYYKSCNGGNYYFNWVANSYRGGTGAQPNISWTSSNESAVTVNGTGQGAYGSFSVVGPGTTTLTVFYTDCPGWQYGCNCAYWATAQAQVTVNVVSILLGGSSGTNITNNSSNPQSVVVGQQIVLYASYGTGVSVTSQSWNLPGTVVAGYSASASSGSLNTNVTRNQQSTTFYWVFPLSGSQTVTFTLNYSVNGTAEPPATVQATFNVTAPSPSAPTVTLEAVRKPFKIISISS